MSASMISSCSRSAAYRMRCRFGPVWISYRSQSVAAVTPEFGPGVVTLVHQGGDLAAGNPVGAPIDDDGAGEVHARLLRGAGQDAGVVLRRLRGAVGLAAGCGCGRLGQVGAGGVQVGFGAFGAGPQVIAGLGQAGDLGVEGLAEFGALAVGVGADLAEFAAACSRAWAASARAWSARASAAAARSAAARAAAWSRSAWSRAASRSAWAARTCRAASARAWPMASRARASACSIRAWASAWTRASSAACSSIGGGELVVGLLAAGLLDGQVPAGLFGGLVGQGAELALGGGPLLGLGPAGLSDRGAFFGGGPGRLHLCLGRGRVPDRVGGDADPVGQVGHPVGQSAHLPQHLQRGGPGHGDGLLGVRVGDRGPGLAGGEPLPFPPRLQRRVVGVGAVGGRAAGPVRRGRGLVTPGVLARAGLLSVHHRLLLRT